MELDPRTDLNITRTLALPPEVVWACWTTPAHIRNFFLPHPQKVTACQIDLRIGGRFETAFDVEGAQQRNTWIYLEIIPHKRLVFTDAFAPGWQPAPEPFMTAVIDFEPAPEGGTTQIATARHASEAAREQHEQMGYHAGWSIIFEQLEAYGQSL